ncbi:MAG TPA: hypothetical protein VFK02_18350 [Kofleriaceae bacterium]|nr:hypothetical protein [Kofleriaceae bacterium]
MLTEKPSTDALSIELFLSPAGTRGQALPRGLGVEALAEAAEGVSADADTVPVSHVDPGGDPSSLRDQGWGVIVPQDEAGDRLLALARPLLDRRAEDQELDVADMRIYRVRPDMSAAEATDWIDRQLVANNPQDAIPGYLLVLGRPEQVSFELQQALAGQFHVGRLGFGSDAGYEAYLAKLLASERAPAGGLARAVYFTARDGTPATELGHRLLMRPCVADAEQLRAKQRFAASEIAAIEDEDDPARAADRLLAAAGGPAVLFSCSHGAGSPPDGWRSPDEQRALQGGLCLGKGQLLPPEAVSGSAFLAGGVWLMFACFGAGTPKHSVYHPWLTRLARHGAFSADVAPVLRSLPGEREPPFLAALPSAALANPDGPLAVISHLDLAWSYGFYDLDKRSRGERHRRFHDLVAQLVKGSRVGLALSGSLAWARSRVKDAIVNAASAAANAPPDAADPGQDARLGHRWMALQDLAGYIVLGDPAARMAVTPPARRRAGTPAAT